MVQLKGEFLLDATPHDTISIPHGTIKRIGHHHHTTSASEFQYLMVQLKDISPFFPEISSYISIPHGTIKSCYNTSKQ